jgi:transcription factor IIIB subunit 2
MKCSKCGSRDIDFQEAGGQSICVNCGTILEENTIVSSIEFQVSFFHLFFSLFLL